MNDIELLSPAGDFDCLKAAVQNGADAVYFGANQFNARANSKNFNKEELRMAIEYAKLRNIKTHLTINILIQNDEFENALDSAEYSGGERHITVVTGYCPYTVIKKLAEMAESRFSGLKCDVMPIRNDFFGNTITVTGLITAGDLISQLNGRDNGSELLISSSMLMQNSEIFLDDMTVSDVEKALDIKIKITQNDGYELLDAILGM